MFEKIFGMSFVLSDRRSESRSWTSTSPNEGRKRLKEFNTACSCLDLWLLLPEDCDVALKRCVEKCRTRCPAAACRSQGVTVEAFSETSLLGIDKHQRVDGERVCGGRDGLVDGLCLLIHGVSG